MKLALTLRLVLKYIIYELYIHSTMVKLYMRQVNRKE
jgi:hypothetical protein